MTVVVGRHGEPWHCQQEWPTLTWRGWRWTASDAGWRQWTGSGGAGDGKEVVEQAS